MSQRQTLYKLNNFVSKLSQNQTKYTTPRLLLYKTIEHFNIKVYKEVLPKPMVSRSGNDWIQVNSLITLDDPEYVFSLLYGFYHVIEGAHTPLNIGINDFEETAFHFASKVSSRLFPSKTFNLFKNIPTTSNIML